MSVDSRLTTKLRSGAPERRSVGCDCKFNPLALGQIQNGADTSLVGHHNSLSDPAGR
jgi:hypothetical protein